MFQTLLDLDAQLLLFFNSFHTPQLDVFMKLFTGRFIWIPMYAAILPILFKKYRSILAIVMLLGLILTIALTDQTCASLIRPLVGRLRPSNPHNPLSEYVTLVNGYRGGSYGFPSCHAANSFALAVYMSLIVKRRIFMAFIFVWASINCYSRMYLGVHYPGDILVGALIGSAFAFATYHCIRKLAGHYLSKKEKIVSDLHLFSGRLQAFGANGPTVRLTAIHVMITIGFGSTVYMLLESVL